jgi:hypothetical protein
MQHAAQHWNLKSSGLLHYLNSSEHKQADLSVHLDGCSRLCCCCELDVRVRLLLLAAWDGDAADGSAAPEQLRERISARVAGEVGHIAAGTRERSRVLESFKG